MGQHEAKAEKTDNDSGVVVVTGMQRRPVRIPRLFWLILVIVLVGSTVGGAYIWLGGKNDLSHQAESNPGLKAVLNDKSLTTSQRYNTLIQQGNYTGAELILKDQLAQAKNDSEKVNNYVLLALDATQAKDYNAAVGYANKALAINPKSDDAFNAQARNAFAQGDKQSAKSYWLRAINSLDKSAPQYDILLQGYNTNIKELGI